MKRIAVIFFAALLATVTLASPARAAALSLNVVSVTSTTATIRWAPADPTLRYTVAWYESTPPNRSWTSSTGGYSARSSPLTLTGLLPAGSYTLYVVPVENGVNAWWDSGRTFITTPSPVGTVPWLVATGSTSDTITINWGAAPGATTYSIYWQDVPSGRTWTSQPDYRRGPVTLTGLVDRREYRIVVTPYNLPVRGFPASRYFYTRGT
jgi:hypothetical protein